MNIFAAAQIIYCFKNALQNFIVLEFPQTVKIFECWIDFNKAVENFKAEILKQ